jgi:hypothetical protein
VLTRLIIHLGLACCSDPPDKFPNFRFPFSSNCLLTAFFWLSFVDTMGSKSSWIGELGETTQASLKDFIESFHGRDTNKTGRTILVGLLGPTFAGPEDDDGWFAADFVMAHHIYGDVGGEQTWLSCVDLVKEAQAGPYLWGYPKEMRTVIFTKDDEAFYTLCAPQVLIATYKEKLQSVVASMTAVDKLLLLIFAHGEQKGKISILVGTNDEMEFGNLTMEEVNSILRPLVGLHSVTLITSACYSGEWHHDARTTFAATGEDEESLTFPLSASGCCRGGYFWEGIWYELSRLGVPTVGKDVLEEETFQAWIRRVQQRVQELLIFNPVPTVSTPNEIILKNHAREVICLHLEKAGFSCVSSLQMVSSNPNPDSVRDEDVAVHHFSGGGSSLSGRADPIFFEDPDAPYYSLPVLMDYFSQCNPGLPNAASCSQVHRLVRLYKKGVGSKADTKNLYDALMYRFKQDLKVGHILSFLRISRVCHIFNFKQWECNIPGMAPYLEIVRCVYPFEEPPKTNPPSYCYTKPVVYLAWSAFMASVDAPWFKKNLELYSCESQMEATLK